MKILVNGLDLNDAIVKVSKALSNREVAPVLECIKFVATDDKLTLFATDKDLSIEKTIEANVIVGGSFLVPGKIFAEYIRSIATETEVSLEIEDDGRLNVSCDASQSNFACMDISSYPAIDTVSNDVFFAITEYNLKEIISKVIFSVATDDTRPIYKGINFVANNYVLTAVATDGYRFALCKKPLENKVDEIVATIPSRSLAELAKLLGDSEDVVRVFIEKNNMMVRLGNTVLMTRLLTNGQFIKYEQVIPTEFVSTLLVNKDTLEKSLNTASIMTRQERNNLISLNIEEYTMRLSSSSEYGTAKEEIAISLNGKDIRCSFNARYINDCLKVIDAETVKMEFAVHNSCVITVNGSDEVLYFILPVKT